MALRSPEQGRAQSKRIDGEPRRLTTLQNDQAHAGTRRLRTVCIRADPSQALAWMNSRGVDPELMAQAVAEAVAFAEQMAEERRRFGW
ncbi:MAG: hypothetical protein M5U08_14220 [Burkholderiales bacterium]|nr:hypothetical protein [Burkholderiales bacterium]